MLEPVKMTHHSAVVGKTAEIRLSPVSSAPTKGCRVIGGRALYLSPTDMIQTNGMSQLQTQLIATLCEMYESVDLLSMGATPNAARKWVRTLELPVNVLSGLYAHVACLNTIAWYGVGAILCNKLRWIDRFYMPIHTPLPKSFIERYDVIVCFYPWLHRLLKLDRAGRKVVVCTGDVMADRHERIGARRWVSLDARDEAAVIQSQSRCVAVSRDDAAEFKEFYSTETPVVQFLPPSYRELISLISCERPARVGYFGAANYMNEEILQLLAQPEFLGVLKQAGIELVVAGGICRTVQRSTLRELERGGAKVLGRIDSMLEFYRQVSVVLNPVGPSTGVKIKSIEALMAGRTLITTRWGAGQELHQAFGDWIVSVEWPIKAGVLGELVVRTVRDATLRDATAAEAYASTANDTLRSILSYE
jgi:hypothetical protein